LLALLGSATIVVVSRLRVKEFAVTLPHSVVSQEIWWVGNVEWNARMGTLTEREMSSALEHVRIKNHAQSNTR